MSERTILERKQFVNQYLPLLFLIAACIAVMILLAIIIPPASAAPIINPSIEQQPFLCQNSLTRWICDMQKPGASGATGIQGIHGINGTNNFSAIYFNASLFTSNQNSSIFINSTNFNVTSNYTVFDGATVNLYNTTAINESYAYLPGRAGGQVLMGGTGENEDLYLDATSSSTKTSAYVVLQPNKGGNVGININNPVNTLAIVNSTFDTTAQITIGQSQSGGTYGVFGWDGVRKKAQVFTASSAYFLHLQSVGGQTLIGGTSASTPTASLHVIGLVRMSTYGAGTAIFDSGGNITPVSDEKLKTSIKPFSLSAISAIKKINPIEYKFKPESGLDTNNYYTGFSAQNLESAIPTAVYTKQDVKYETITKKDKNNEEISETIEIPLGTYTKSISDRAIIATLVNAIKEQQIQIEAQNEQIKILTERINQAGIK